MLTPARSSTSWLLTQDLSFSGWNINVSLSLSLLRSLTNWAHTSTERLCVRHVGTFIVFPALLNQVAFFLRERLSNVIETPSRLTVKRRSFSSSTNTIVKWELPFLRRHALLCHILLVLTWYHTGSVYSGYQKKLKRPVHPYDIVIGRYQYTVHVNGHYFCQANGGHFFNVLCQVPSKSAILPFSQHHAFQVRILKLRRNAF